MKISEALKTEKAQRIFEAAFIILLLFIIPMWGKGRGKYAGGLAMIAVSIIGVIAYFVLFGQRLRGRGQLKAMAVASIIGAAVSAAILFWLTRAHWH